MLLFYSLSKIVIQLQWYKSERHNWF